MDATTALRALGGAGRRRHLVERGVDPRRLHAALKAGWVLRPHRGVYALRGAEPDVVAARVWAGALTCVSGCRAWGLPLLESDAAEVCATHVAVDRHRGLARDDPRGSDGVRLHRVDGGRDVLGDRHLASPQIVLAHLGLCVAPLDQLVAVDAALRQGLIRPGDVANLAPYDARRRAFLVDHADARTDSPAETLARVAMRVSGLRPEPHAYFAGIGTVDFVVGGSLVVEIDGRDYHSDPAAFARDRRRDALLMECGTRVLRFPAQDVFRDADAVARMVHRVLGG